VFDRCDAEAASRFPAHGCHVGQPGFDPVEMRPHGLDQAFTRLGRRDAARVAGQEPQSQPGFKVPDDAAEGRLGHAELRRSPREAPLRSLATARRAIRSLTVSRAIYASKL